MIAHGGQTDDGAEGGVGEGCLEGADFVVDFAVLCRGATAAGHVCGAGEQVGEAGEEVEADGAR